MRHSHDLLVIGGGSAGLVAARFAASLGARVALAEAHRIGGDCTWTGCVPSKALLRAARAARDVREAGRFGVQASDPVVDMAAVRDYVLRAVAEVYEGETPETLVGEGIEVIPARAHFLDANAVQVGDRVLTPRRVLISTGAKPSIPPIPGLEQAEPFTHETIFENARLPGHLLVLGAGPIGLELAYAYRSLGAQVTVVGEEFLPREDPEVRAFVRGDLEARGVRIVDARVESVESSGGTTREIRWSTGSVEGDALLVATGRAPNVGGLGLDKAGISYGRGGIVVDSYLRSTNARVYAAGDVTGGPQFTHYAGWQGFQAVRNALLPGRERGVTDLIPRVTFLHPEIASVGLSEDEARARHGDRVVVLRREMAHTDRAIAEGATEGFVKFVADGKDRILGASIVAERAGEMIQEVVLAMSNGITLTRLASSMHAYPTWSMAVQRLAADHGVSRFRSSRAGAVARWLAGLR